MAIKDSISSFIEVDIVSTSGTVLPSGIQIDELIFTRSGNDLILAGPGGQKLNVRNYFNQDDYPPIVAADGNRLSGEDVVLRATTLFATDNNKPTQDEFIATVSLDPQLQSPGTRRSNSPMTQSIPSMSCRGESSMTSSKVPVLN